MKICIDATSLLLRSAGVKNYVYHWMRALKAAAPRHDIRAFPLLGDVGELDHERSTVTLAQTLPRLALLHFVNKVYHRAIDASVGPVDVFHASSQVHASPRGAKLTATIYDMTPALLPDFHTDANVRAEQRFYRNVLRKADGLIAISESTRADAVRMLDLDPRRVTVIYPGIDERFFSAAPAEAAKPYVLCLGTIEPRKNVDGLLDAWLQLPAEVRRTHELLIGGPVGWNSDRTMDRIESGIVGVRRLGYIPEADLPGVVAGATVFAYPSFYEGFGFPLAQAMAAGVACVSSDVSSMPEVLGDTGLLVDPRNSTALRDALLHLLESPSDRARFGAAARERARRFSWRAAAEQSVGFFEALA